MLPIDRLPTELLSRAIGYLKLNDILRVARSNRRWRHVALNHPKFWRDVVVDEFGDMSLALTKARIAAARRRPLHLDFVHRHQGSRAERILIDIVGPVISHVRILRVTVNSLYIMTLWRVLMHESPLLEQLEVTLHLDDNAHLVEVKNIALPSRVLAGNAPRLRCVALKNVFVAYDTPSVLHDVTEFRFTLPEGTYLSFPRWIFSDLPNLERLWLTAGYVLFDKAPFQDWVLDGVARLHFFAFDCYNYCALQFFRHLPIDRIPTVVVPCPSEDMTYAALEPMRSPFSMSILHNIDDEFSITVTSPRLGLSRQFVEFYETHTPGSDNINRLLWNQDFAEQVEELTIATSLWTRVHPLLPSYPNLHTLVVYLNDRDTSLPQESVYCHTLVRLVLAAPESEVAAVSAKELDGFIQRVTQRRVELILRRAYLTDCPSDISSTSCASITSEHA